MWVTRKVLMKYRGSVCRDQEGGDGAGGGAGGSGGGAGDDGKGGSGDAGDDGKGDGKGGAGDGKPTDAEAKLIKEVMEKKNKLKEASAKVAELEAKIKQFEGIDPEAIKKMLAEKADADTKALEAKGEWGRLKEQMVAQHNAALQAKETEIGNLKSALASMESTIAELTVGNSFGNSKFVAEELTLTPGKARVVFGSHFEFAEGKVVAFDKPAGSKDRTMLVNAQGEALSFDEALKKLVETDPDRDTLIKSKVKQGAGSHQQPGKSGKPGAEQKATLHGRDRIAEALAAKAKK